MRVDLFDFDLPPERIALAPASPREAARMLIVDKDDALDDRHIGDLPEFIRPGDALVVNDTRVIAGRLSGVRVRGESVAQIEATLIKRVDESRWRAFVRPAKKLNPGERIRFGETSESMACLLGALDEAIERLGEMPLPPYIAARRAPNLGDRADYQTLFANEPGAVAAPTAGLHFTPELVSRVRAAGASLHKVTLHVGAGTFLPVKVDETQDHVMHAEWGRIDG